MLCIENFSMQDFSGLVDLAAYGHTTYTAKNFDRKILTKLTIFGDSSKI